MSNAETKKVDITGAGSTDKLLKLDIATHKSGGTIGYTRGEASPDKNINDNVTIQGLKGVVAKTGSSQSRSAFTSYISAELGNAGAKKYVAIVKPVDDATFLPYYFSDIVDAVAAAAGINIDYVGYDLQIEEYSFSGRVIDCLNDLAGMVYGTVQYVSEEDKYVVVAGHLTYTTPGGGGAFTVVLDDLISWDVSTEKDTSLRAFGSNVIALAKELAKLRAALLELKATTIASTTTRTLNDRVFFNFGWKNGFQPIPHDIEVDSIHWDEWYFEAGSKTKYSASTGTAEFLSKQTHYFKVETIKECVSTTAPGGGPTTVTRGKQRGLRSIGIGTKLYARLKNMQSGDNIRGKGYTINMDTLGIPSITKYKELADASAGSDYPFDDCYHVMYDIEIREIKVKLSETSNLTGSEYIPFLRLTVNPAFINAVYDGVKKAKMAAGDTTNPTDTEVIEASLYHQYGASIEVMGESESFNLKYKGAQDKYGRLISESGQVLLVYAQSTETSTAGTYKFFGPIEGIDMSLKLENVAPPTGSAGSTISSLINDYFDETALTTKVINAYNDLKKLCANQTPIGTYDAVAPGVTPGYPRFIYEHLTTPSSTGSSIGGLIGVEYKTNAYIDSTGEPTGPLSMSNYTSIDKQRKQIERKLKCIESKITLIAKCVVFLDPGTAVDKTMIKNLVKTVITYNTILERAKNESIATLISMRTAYENAINDCLKIFSGETNAKLHTATVTVVLPETLPAIGTAFSLPSTAGAGTGSYKVTAVNVSGVTATITGEYHG